MSGATGSQSCGSSDASGSGACTTPEDGTGQCPSGWTSYLKKRNKSVTFTVDNVAIPLLQYQPAENHDPDGDSDGTTITIVKP